MAADDPSHASGGCNGSGRPADPSGAGPAAAADAPARPETRDWTAVLRRPCDECGFDPSGVDGEEVPDRIRATIPRWRQVLGRPAEEIAARPAADVWSPLEYACHARDVCRTFIDRVALIRVTPVPALPARFADWDQNAAQVRGLYGAQVPVDVAGGYAAAAGALAGQFAHVAGGEWGWEGVRGDGARFTVLDLAAYLVHDLEHHLADVGG